MRKSCRNRDRLREAYYEATQIAFTVVRALDYIHFGLEFESALEKAEAAHLAVGNAQRAYEEHCIAHGCEAEFHGSLWSAVS
jgi:hypothetical protein